MQRKKRKKKTQQKEVAQCVRFVFECSTDTTVARAFCSTFDATAAAAAVHTQARTSKGQSSPISLSFDYKIDQIAQIPLNQSPSPMHSRRPPLGTCRASNRILQQQASASVPPAGCAHAQVSALLHRLNTRRQHLDIGLSRIE